jgi:hypothetical protein
VGPERSGPPEPRPVEVRTRFERFPASLKGAFVLRGADGNPHAIRLEWARLARIPTGPAKPVPVEDRMLDVAPSRDLFVPFEVGVSELEPAWYVIESAVRVDAGRTWEFESRAFTIPWPRSELRRGTFRLDRAVEAGGRAFHLDRVELGADTAAVVWSEDGPGSGAHAVLLADGRVQEVLPDEAVAGRAEHRTGPGERRTVSYPVPRSTVRLEVQVRLSRSKHSEPVGVPIHAGGAG